MYCVVDGGEAGLQDPCLARPLVEMSVTSWGRDVTKASETHLSDCVHVSQTEVLLEATCRAPPWDAVWRACQPLLLLLLHQKCRHPDCRGIHSVTSYRQILAKLFRNLRRGCGGI
ncbi:hypothetical protein E2C01_069309 [Portunus trituberculatus]|uniref:Uncharacterized protein n=1 Tax=Portunus trituberculatus TaxID=210409 RepID=A0A5B7HYZ8_PORTR|nr:hypothetical protein [Portunus trituberculatus]